MNLTTIQNAYEKATQEMDWAMAGQYETMSPVRSCMFYALAQKRKRQAACFSNRIHTMSNLNPTSICKFLP